jgi:hypothetical protein
VQGFVPGTLTASTRIAWPGWRSPASCSDGRT